MSTNEQIVVRVTTDGAVHAETKGIKGAKCLDSISVLEDILEATTLSSAFTPEYNETKTQESVELNDEQHQY